MVSLLRKLIYSQTLNKEKYWKTERNVWKLWSGSTEWITCMHLNLFWNVEGGGQLCEFKLTNSECCISWGFLNTVTESCRDGLCLCFYSCNAFMEECWAVLFLVYHRVKFKDINGTIKTKSSAKKRMLSFINIAFDNAVYLILLRVIQKQSLLREA